MAEDLGNERVANVVLIGALSTALDFPAEDWERALTEFVPKKTIAVNLEAFRLGRSWITEARTSVPGSKRRRRAPPRPPKRRTPGAWKSRPSGARAATSASSSAPNAACASIRSVWWNWRSRKNAPAAGYASCCARISPFACISTRSRRRK